MCKTLKKILHQSSDSEANHFIEALFQEAFLEVTKIRQALRRGLEAPGTPESGSSGQLAEEGILQGLPVTNPLLQAQSVKAREPPSYSGGEKSKEEQSAIMREQIHP